MTTTAPVKIHKPINRIDQKRNEVKYMSSTAAELSPRSHGPVRIAESLGIALVNWSRKQDPALNAEAESAHAENLRIREFEAARTKREIDALRRMQRFGV